MNLSRSLRLGQSAPISLLIRHMHSSPLYKATLTTSHSSFQSPSYSQSPSPSSSHLFHSAASKPTSSHPNSRLDSSPPLFDSQHHNQHQNDHQNDHHNNQHPLAALPTSHILRTYLLTTLTSTPLLLRTTLAILSRIVAASSSSSSSHPPPTIFMRLQTRILSVTHNPLLRTVLQHTLYAQFCAGSDGPAVRRALENAKRRIGCRAVIVEYALEVLEEEEEENTSEAGMDAMQVVGEEEMDREGEKVLEMQGGREQRTAEEIEVWRRGMLLSVDMVGEGDYVALKWSGMGQEALARLNANQPPSESMYKAMIEVCDAAAKKGVALLPGAELEKTNAGIDLWSIHLQKLYNREKPVVYATYQAYLKSTPSNLAKHLAIAKRDNFLLAVKLVRGAYMKSEPKGSICSSKQKPMKPMMESFNLFYKEITTIF